MSGTIKIRVTNDGKLKDPGEKKVKVNSNEDTIRWKVKYNNHRFSFKLTPKYLEKPYPFKEPLPLVFQEEIELTVADVENVQGWEYNIIWRNDPNDNVGFKIDPKLVIEPDPFLPPRDDNGKLLIAIVSAVVVAGFTLAFNYFNRRLRHRY